MATASPITIEVLGSGCAKCHTLFERTKTAAAALGIEADVVHTTAIERLIELNVLTSPALVVNGVVVVTGSVPDLPTLTALLQEHIHPGTPSLPAS
jgi:small redox-active disulfide protein 2